MQEHLHANTSQIISTRSHGRGIADRKESFRLNAPVFIREKGRQVFPISKLVSENYGSRLDAHLVTTDQMFVMLGRGAEVIHIVPFPESLRFVSLTNWEQLNCSTIMLSRSRSSHSNGVATWLQLRPQ